ncbi:MAG TPA: carbohydrate ABC transporter permease [Candidatus Gemmiger avicola]|uniref:Carbohydrate ABC transporter permease n=1 Tax=Candidatus Gemmiger avicola TaxID=2838605 RepID=A0A9D2S2E6_9FIRM|nr:carbohydrate ABC transporter permease [Candidatus Gemmiger avicola]
MTNILHKKDDGTIHATGTLEKRSPGDQVVQVLIYALIALIAVLCLLPFIYVIAGSFATERELTERPFFLIPREFSINAYSYIFKDGSVFRGLRNSILVTVVGTLINMFVSCTIAYPLSRPYLKGRNGFINMVIVTMLFSGGMVPSYIMVMNVLHLGNTYWALWLPIAMNAFNMIIIKNYFQSLPMELEEAAIIDGSNDLLTFIRIILPLSTPVLASVGLFYAVSHWNSYFNAMMYINNTEMEVMPIVLRRMVFLTNQIAQDSNFDWGAFGQPPAKSVKMAVTVVSTIPMLCVYPFVQKYFTQGLMVGSVKG